MLQPYGFWGSPISSEELSGAVISFQELRSDREFVYWTESRPLEKGRNALMRYKVGEEPQEIFPYMDVRTKVHEYGGGSFLPADTHLVVYDEKSKTLYIEDSQKNLTSLIQDFTKRFADFCLTPDKSALFCVCEDHGDEKQVHNYLVRFDLRSGKMQKVHEGEDFYASPRCSSDGCLLAFICWRHPNMPWDESKMIVASLKGDGTIEPIQVIGQKKEAISQLTWRQQGSLYYTSDLSGFSNLYVWKEGKTHLLYQMDADYSPPLWILGRKHFELIKIEEEKAILCSYCEKGVDHLAILHLNSGVLEKIATPFTVIRTLSVQNDLYAFFIGGSPSIPLSIISLNIKTKEYQIIASSFDVQSEWGPFLSLPELIEAPSSVGEDEIFGFYYPPKNPMCKADEHTLPPLIVRCHGGPTAHAQPILSLDVQFWTTRGFAWLDVNYRGSSGHGKKYREALCRAWGVVDVSDCRDMAMHLAAEGKVNAKQMFIRGGSAGGFTALSAAAASKDFLGCTSLYGVTDLTALTQSTHKFERDYLESLVGVYPRDKQTYEKRSPVSHAEKISCAVLLLQGDQDPVVPLSQARLMYDKLKMSGAAVELIVFEGEGHGFRRSDTLQQAIEAEFKFYLSLLGLELHEDL